ncbi:MAG TPA: Asp-tRNA(Asn)/Glu-tRNA(Gln) amidotransferase subunit GatC [Candidatus Paceibacterota bacterium]|nr:Asp-tRNA(Asn)/Glu-tRNA(Gln) amidotransferase subunit GatC [Candidatus Paceibacterota bacterium]
MEIKDIGKLAALSRINLPDSEKESLLKEMDAILAYVDQVKEATAAQSAAVALHKPFSRNIFREDAEPHPAGAFNEALLESSPDRQGQYIKVKKIL